MLFPASHQGTVRTVPARNGTYLPSTYRAEKRSCSLLGVVGGVVLRLIRLRKTEIVINIGDVSGGGRGVGGWGGSVAAPVVRASHGALGDATTPFTAVFSLFTPSLPLSRRAKLRGELR